MARALPPNLLYLLRISDPVPLETLILLSNMLATLGELDPKATVGDFGLTILLAESGDLSFLIPLEGVVLGMVAVCGLGSLLGEL